ncbi:MAG: type sorting protein [Ignavibacteria bacterium]|nr:type sorting protein [Ignavibacteria bacterium]
MLSYNFVIVIVFNCYIYDLKIKKMEFQIKNQHKEKETQDGKFINYFYNSLFNSNKLQIKTSNKIPGDIMKTIYQLIVAFIALLILNVNANASPEAQKILDKANKSYFIENKGQWAPEVKFQARIGGMNAWITNTGIVYDYYKIIKSNPNHSGNDESRDLNNVNPKDADNLSIKGHVVKITNNDNSSLLPKGDFPVTKFNGINKSEGRYNYFLGNDKTKWASNVSLYNEVQIANVYDGIDVRYYYDEGQIRYDYVVKPGADLSQIRLKVDIGDDDNYYKFINSNGELVIRTSIGEVTQGKLFAYQFETNDENIADNKLSTENKNSEKIQISANFIMYPDGSIGFETGNYNRDLALIIDPLVYSTFIGGVNNDFSTGLMMDPSRNSIVIGYTNSNASSFPVTSGAYDVTLNGGNDLFVTKFNFYGTSLDFTTYIGGSGADFGQSLYLDGSNNIYVTGYTLSTNYPSTSGAFDASSNGTYDIIVSKINSTGSSLLYSTYVGASEADYSTSIAVDGSGNAYVVGYTASTTFPTTSGAYDVSHNGGNDIIVFKLNSGGTALSYSTFIGGTGDDLGNSIAVDGSGYAYIGGNSLSGNYPTTSGSYQTTIGGATDVIVTKLNTTGTALVYSTFVGNTSHEFGNALVIDDDGNAYITGETRSNNFPTTSGAYDQSFNLGLNDVYVTKLNSSGTGLVYSTFIGGTSTDIAYSMAIDKWNDIFITGNTGSTNYPTTSGAYGTSASGLGDIFISKLNPSGNILMYSTYIGGTAADNGKSIAWDGSLRNVFIAGNTQSTNYPVSYGAFDESSNGNSDAFVTKIQDVGLTTPYITTGTLSSATICSGTEFSVSFTVGGGFFDDINIFNAEISDSAGNFNYATNIGDASGTTSGTITCNLPGNIPIGTHYRIRINGSDPFVFGSDNGTDLIIPIPVALAKNNSISLNANGSATLTPSEVDNGSYAYCGLKSMSVNPSVFSCSNMGANSVTLTITDNNDNISWATSIVTVINVAPVVITKNITLYLNSNGSASITPASVDNGSYDDCGIQSMVVTPNTFSCSNVGINVVNLTVTDTYNSYSSGSATVTVLDTVPPSLITQNYSINLNSSGSVTLQPENVIYSHNDACGLQSFSVNPITFTCSDNGNNSVTITTTDNNNNSTTGTAIVTVNDGVPPVVLTQNITIQLDAQSSASLTAAQVDNGSYDPCGLQSLTVNPSIFNCTNLGVNSVTLTATDISNNSSYAVANVTVQDLIPPTVITQNITVQLNYAGLYTLNPSGINNGSTDNCGIQSLSVSPSTFTCSNIGNNSVTLTVTDGSGNVAHSTSLVTVEDLTPPDIYKKNLTVQLNSSGFVSISASDVDNGSWDACGIYSMTLSSNTYGCSNVGNNSIIFTVTDNYGNSSTATSIVTVQDITAPTALTKNITVQLDSTGFASITASDVDSSSNDACGIQYLTLSSNTFNCSDIGNNSVTLTVTDNNDNVSSATAVVTIQGNASATAIAKNITKVLNSNGTVTITASEIDNGSYSCSGIQSMSVYPNTFTCSNIGNNSVTLTVTDNNNNVATATSIVYIQDATAPTAIAKNITVQLNAAGTVSIAASDVNNNSSDACGIASLAVSPSSFNCTNVGANNVTLTVTDNNGNVSTAISVVTVQDVTVPSARVKNISPQLYNNDQVYTDYNDGEFGNFRDLYSAYKLGQSFRPSVNHQITKIRLRLGVYGTMTSGQIWLTIQTDSGGSPSGTVIGTSENVNVNVVTGNGWIDFIFSTPTSELTAETTYWIVLQGNQTRSDNNYLKWICNTLNGYTRGVGKTNETSWANFYDFCFTEYYTPATSNNSGTFQLDASGNASIAVSDINDNSTDACGIASITVSPSSFNCTNVGNNSVTLTVTDNNGNISTATTVVTVQDVTAPTAIPKNICNNRSRRC